MEPKVSVVLYSYNYKDFIRSGIESVLNQTYRNIELIISDNNSTDGALDIIKSYARDPRVKLLLHNDNVLLGRRFNEGIFQATGDFISILYADDYYLPHKIERQVECFSRLPPEYGIVYSPGYRLNTLTGEKWTANSLKSSGSILKDIFLKYHTEGFTNPVYALARKECFIRYPFSPDVMYEGEAIYMRMALRYKFHYLDEPVAVMRDHLSNWGKAAKTNREIVLRFLDSLRREPEFPRELLPALTLFGARQWRNYGWQGIRVAEDPRWARECYGLAIRWSPMQLLHPRTLGGLFLSVLPKRLIHLLNLAANRILRHRETQVLTAMERISAK